MSARQRSAYNASRIQSLCVALEGLVWKFCHARLHAQGSDNPDYIAEALVKVAQAKQELLATKGDVENAWALVRLIEAEHDLTILERADLTYKGARGCKACSDLTPMGCRRQVPLR